MMRAYENDRVVSLSRRGRVGGPFFCDGEHHFVHNAFSSRSTRAPLALVHSRSVQCIPTLQKGKRFFKNKSRKESSREQYDMMSSFINDFFVVRCPYVTGFVTTFAERPDVILCNGPGTCIPLCAAAFVLRVISPVLLCPPPFRLSMPAIVYVESIARVASLSLSGKLLYHLRLADAVYVQWEGLQRKYPRTIYAGRIM